MAYTPVPEVETEDEWSAANHNVYIKDNFAEIWKFDDAGQLIYSLTNTTASKLNAGAAGTMLTMFGGFPAWKKFVAKRQGTNATDWTLGGGTNYDVTNVIVQLGTKYRSTIAEASGTIALTFPQAFSEKPIVFVTPQESSVPYVVTVDGISTTGCTLYWTCLSGTLGTQSIFWMAIGAE